MRDMEKPFKQRDIKPCMACGGKLMAGGSVTFYRITAEYLMLDVGEIRRQAGFEQMMGGGDRGRKHRPRDGS